ncbi:MAG TPA: RluA family pseudouridine synthase [Sulfurovum sp.]|nr:RluA family pseudouridine synthase [Sulfurovum sp.]
MGQQYRVKTRSKLLPFLFEVLEGWSKKRVKQRLQSASVAVNGTISTKHDFYLSEGDVVEVGVVQPRTQGTQQSNRKLEIIHQDKDLIAINKPAGLLSVGSNKETKNHALALLRTQLTRGKERVQLWPVHRLDRETSGILLFATSKDTREAVMAKWSESEKTYLAVVEGAPKEEKDTITEPLRLDEKEYRMHVGAHKDAKSAITHYKVLESNDKRSLLEVNIETGRQHQIRAHMAWVGNAVVGDERYGTKGGHMGLHAHRLSFVHPASKNKITLEVDAPREFYALIKG